MKEYHKIDTVFERDILGTKKLIEGKFRDPLVEYLKDNEWIFTEKIDGTNIRVHWDGHSMAFGGRTDNAQIPSHLLKWLQDKFLNNETEELFEQKFGDNEVTFYGEGFGEKIQSGGAYGEVSFILFDVQVGDVYIKRDGVEDLAVAFGIECVPVILRGSIQQAVEYVKTKPRSVVARGDKESEGLVGVPSERILNIKGERIIIKIKVQDFTH